MKRLLFISIFFLNYFDVTSQVEISPEVGIYYRPYTFRGIANSIEKKELDYYLGFMGEVKLMSKIYAQSHFAYIFRQSTEAASEIHTHLHDLKSGLFTNKEMYINLDVLYSVFKTSKIGLGLGILHKLDSEVQENYFNKNTVLSHFSPSSIYNMSVVITNNWGRLGLSARYFYQFKSENLESNRFRILDDRSGFTLGFNYKLFGYK